MTNNNSSILIIEAGGIGDLVMAIPAIRALRENHPHSYIVALVTKRAKPLLKGCPYINEVFTFEIDNFTFSKYMLNLLNTFESLRTIVALRKKKFNFAVNLHRIASFWGSLRMKSLFKLIRPEMSAGRDTDKRGRFYDVRLEEELNDSEHEVTKKLKLVKMIGVDVSNSELELWIDYDDKTYVDNLLDEYNITNDCLIIGINPNSAQPSKLWLDDRFAALADILSARYNAKVILVGSVKNKRRTGEILSLAKNVHVDFAGKVTLSQLETLINRISVFITLDSGPMHIASAFKVPTIALFGPGNPSKFGPYHNEKAFVLKKEKMSAISVDEVIDLFDSLVRKYNI